VKEREGESIMKKLKQEGSEIEILENLPNPVFIVGMNGSGTSMLADSIGKHPELYVFKAETRLLPYLITKLERYGDLQIDKNFLSLWNSVLSIPNLRWANDGNAPPLPVNWRDFQRSFDAIVDAVFRFCAAKEGKIRWGEKTPQHVQHMETLHGVFPSAKFIHIIRDGRDCAASLQRRFLRNPERSIYRWKKIVREGRMQGKMLGDLYMEVMYENVTSDPEKWMAKICSFVELPFNENVLRSSQPFKEKRVKEGGIEPNSGKWRRYFTESENRKLEAISGNCLRELGYPVSAEAGDHDPSNAKLWAWMMEDYRREFVAIGKRMLKKDGANAYRIIYNSVIRAIKQKSVNKY
jgi:hypothetical protein